MEGLRKCLRTIDAINEWIAKIVSWVVLIIIAVTVYEVVMRYAFNAPTQWVFEFDYLVHGVYFMLLGAYTLAVRGHVNVDIIHQRLQPRTRALVDLLTAPLFYLFMTMMFWMGGKFALNAVAMKETLSSAWAPPIYPIKLVIPLGAAMMLLQGTAKLIRDLHLFLTGREGEL
jgi:TRAP-type mannitol/chloroaromatic compound transport system permease small subunit